MSKKLVFTACALAASSLALAKLPPLDEAAKAKAAETAAKAAWQAKVDAFQLCKVQDRIAGQFRGKTAKPAGTVTTAGTVTGVTSPMTPTVAATGAAAPAATGAPAAAAAAAIAKAPSNSTNPTTASQGGATPVATVAAVPPAATPCADPGVFAFNPPAQTPLETSGAHSPAGNAVQPPSVQPNSAQMAPAGPATQQSKQPTSKR